MNWWSHFCFLVLAISSVCSQQKTPTLSSLTVFTTTQGTTTPAPDSPTTNFANRTDNNDTKTSLAPTSSQDYISDNSTTEDNVTRKETEKPHEKAPPGTSTKAPDKNLVTVTATVTVGSTTPDPDLTSISQETGYVMLSLIIVAILVLCIILYLLRRASRSYSFDLRPEPMSSQFNEPTGTFEPVYLDDLDQPAPKDEETTKDLSPPPVSNGTSLQLDENSGNGENAPQEHQEQPEANGLETSPNGDTSPVLDNDSPDLLFDAVEEVPQNENNNNPSIFSSDPFVEINLDEPAWRELFSSPNATSSVLPFSPFSFSSTTSS